MRIEEFNTRGIHMGDFIKTAPDSDPAGAEGAVRGKVSENQAPQDPRSMVCVSGITLPQTPGAVKTQKTSSKRGFSQTADPTRARGIDKLNRSDLHPGIEVGLRNRKAQMPPIG
jgi:hypothetical protein